jgi:methylated-DNA-[protein]-cysteine S-methyltransferase
MSAGVAARRTNQPTAEDTRVEAAWLNDRPGPGEDSLTRALDRLYREGPAESVQAAAIERVRGKVRAADLEYGRLRSSPLGAVYVAWSRRGLVALDFGVSETAFLERVRRETGRRARPGNRASALEQVREYLAGRRTRFSVPIDLSHRTEFQQRVLQATLEVPHGRVATYHEIARRIGKPRAARAVGRALATNPIPLIIPCHRVIGSNGSLTGYGGKGGTATKARLLRMEGALGL